MGKLKRFLHDTMNDVASNHASEAYEVISDFKEDRIDEYADLAVETLIDAVAAHDLDEDDISDLIGEDIREYMEQFIRDDVESM